MRGKLLKDVDNKTQNEEGSINMKKTQYNSESARKTSSNDLCNSVYYSNFWKIVSIPKSTATFIIECYKD